MPFTQSENRTQNNRGSDNNKGAGTFEHPLTRWGGLYVSRSGKAIAGNISLSRIDRESGKPFGDLLLEQIKQCMKEERPLRIVVWENDPDEENPKRPPYTVSSTLGMVRPSTQEQGTERIWNPPPTPPPDPSPGNQREGYTPSPTRLRSAPRR